MLFVSISILFVSLFVGTESFTLSSEASGKTLNIDCGSDVIEIGSATYGGNCGASTNNQLVNLGRSCNYENSCSYTVNHNVIGDPVPGCAKTYTYDYICKTGGILSSEASGKTLSINCGSSLIDITSATYGGNCGASTNNQLTNLGNACNGRNICSYTVNHNVIGDPAVGCAKTYGYNYECDDSNIISGTLRKLSNPSQCLDVSGSSSIDNVILFECHGGSNQEWSLGAEDSDGYGLIISSTNGECLDVNAGSNGIVDDGDNLTTWPCHGGWNQLFKFDGNIIRVKKNGQVYCLNVENSNVQIAKCDPNNDNQKIVFITNEQITIESREYDLKCLDKSGSGTDDNMIIWPCHGGLNQKWRRSLPDSDGYYVLINEYNKECLDANAGDGIINSGDNITTWPCHGGTNQKWYVGNVLIRSKASGNYCLEANNANSNVYIENCDNYALGQRFTTEVLSI